MKEKEFQSKPLLTKREREVFELLVQDKTTKEIASELFISEKTVRNHISNAKHTFCKLIPRSIKITPKVIC
ncbi:MULTISPECIES: helix-turn-helix domain-containing protein [Bacillus]|uniref:helix-turn-helix domain-containing protein n=2 Tax=Bacillaceae TaxID=186817 RepID=UPI00077687A7|nr:MULTISPECIES: LuxR C-terminal-related transcriptional regulator [Bacillus]AMM98179.1 LuxR family transcriptional regulator [Bacillus pumilus]PAK33346.1 DNA-binding response regulator [Bacillus safensis]PRO43109.1 DNA-binding response regulator [Bacillus sp. LLTC93]